MTTFKRIVAAGALIGLLSGTAFAGPAALQNATAPAPVMAPGGKLLPATQALFNGYVAADKMPGIVAAFGYDDFPTAYVAAGKIGDEYDAARADQDSLWRVYSMTKPITGMAAMILIEQGKLQLDEPISDFFPAFKTMRVQNNANTLDSHPATTPITVRMLLTHTAGLGYTIITKGPLKAEYIRLGLTPQTVSRYVEQQYRHNRPTSLAAFANRVAQAPLIAEPGTKWSYSIGLDVLGAVIEKASGMPFDAFVQKAIFNPLKMRSSYWTVPRSEARRLASNALFFGDDRVPLDPGRDSVWLSAPEFPYGGAGLVMSAHDYDCFLHMLQNYGTLDGVRVMKPETARLAMSNLLPDGVKFAPGLGFGAGGSVVLADQPNGATKGTYGWSGAAGTQAFVDPVHKLRGDIMVNYFPGDKYPIRNDVLAALKKDLAGVIQ
jgi:CubicO group peptidase (beta-lactamase class C family)